MHYWIATKLLFHVQYELVQDIHAFMDGYAHEHITDVACNTSAYRMPTNSSLYTPQRHRAGEFTPQYHTEKVDVEYSPASITSAWLL